MRGEMASEPVVTAAWRGSPRWRELRTVVTSWSMGAGGALVIRGSLTLCALSWWLS